VADSVAGAGLARGEREGPAIAGQEHRPQMHQRAPLGTPSRDAVARCHPLIEVGIQARADPGVGPEDRPAPTVEAHRRRHHRFASECTLLGQHVCDFEQGKFGRRHAGAVQNVQYGHVSGKRLPGDGRHLEGMPHLRVLDHRRLRHLNSAPFRSGYEGLFKTSQVNGPASRADARHLGKIVL
jgi:hypothetical protein